MPRIGQLLSALLVALVGVLVVQMFLFAALQQERVANQLRPSVAAGSAAAPAPRWDALLSPSLDPLADHPASAPPELRILVIIIGQPEDQPSARSDGGKALIERFIALTGTRTHPSQSGKED